MDLSHGGHLTHGHPVTYVTKIFNFVRYKMKDIETGEIDYDEMREVALREKPRIVLAGFSAYPREIDYARMNAIAEEVGAYAVADMAHIAGLIAGKAVRNPFDDGFDVILTTTHKTLRGPRGGMILTREANLGKKIDKSVFSRLSGRPDHADDRRQGGGFRRSTETGIRGLCATDDQECPPHGGKVHAVRCAPDYQRHRQPPAADRLRKLLGHHGPAGGGTVGPGRHHAEQKCHCDDARKPLDPSGIRLGTPAVTTRGMNEAEMDRLVEFMLQAVACREDETALDALHEEVKTFCLQFPVPGIGSA